MLLPNTNTKNLPLSKICRDNCIIQVFIVYTGKPDPYEIKCVFKLTFLLYASVCQIQ